VRPRKPASVNGKLVRTMLRLVPEPWRAAVRSDLADEAATRGRGCLWMTWHVALTAVRLRRGSVTDAFGQDLRYALRSILAARAFSVGTIVTFALAIGVNLMVFSAVDRLTFRSLPYANPDGLFLLGGADRNTGEPLTRIPVPYVQAADERIPEIASWFPSPALNVVLDAGTDAPLTVHPMRFHSLSVLGVRPVLGRAFVESDEHASHPVVLLAYRVWQQRFGGRSDVVGRTLSHPSQPAEVIGVLPSGFIPPGQFLSLGDGIGVFPGLTRTMTSTATDARLPSPVVRLIPGADADAIDAALAAVASDVSASLPAALADRAVSTLHLRPLDSALLGDYRAYLRLLVVTTALVLLIACANLGSLFLVRARARRHVHAMQLALGASRWRVARVALAEAGLLSCVGAAVGILVTWWGAAALDSTLPAVFTRYATSPTDPRVLLAAAVLAAFSAAAAGAAPCWLLNRVDVLGALRRRGAPGRARRGGVSAGLLALTTAVAFVLVAGTALTARSFLGLLWTDLGWQPDGLYEIEVGTARPDDAATRYGLRMQVLDMLRQHPAAVRAAGAYPITTVVGMRTDRPGPFTAIATPDFFDTVGISRIAGRPMGQGDVGQPVAWPSEAAVRVLWPGTPPANVVGRALPPPHEPRLVAGVVANVRSAPDEPVRAWLYVPPDPTTTGDLWFVVRARADDAPSVSELRGGLEAAGLNPSSVSVRREQDRLDRRVHDQRFRATLFLVFGITALGLAAVGLYAVAASDVVQRRREMGIRLALGARSGGLQRRVIVEALRPVVPGAAAGLVVTWWAALYLQSFLYEVDARDPWTFGAVALVLVATAAIAAWLPARRAAKTDPASVLRVA